MPDPPTSLQAELADIVGEEHLITDDERLANYERDWTGGWNGKAEVAVRPGSSREVAAVLASCCGLGTRMVVQGGNTGLVGGATPLDREVVLDTTRLDELGEVDLQSRQVTIGAGVALEQAQVHVASAGLDIAVDLAARSRATIGGMVATDAGGALALSYGTMRESVVGLEAVLADGRILTRLSGLLKDNAGYDLPALLIGSEGTLAVLTRVRLQLVKRPAHRAVALLGTDGYEEAVELVTSWRDTLGPSLEAADCLDRTGMKLVCAHQRIRDPLATPHELYVIVQVADQDDPAARLAEAVGENGPDDIAVAEDTERRQALWAYREGLNEAVGARGVARKYDVSVPVSQIAEFAAAARAEIGMCSGGAQSVIYGHLGDGNLHLNVLDRPGKETLLDDNVSALVAAHNGSISAEHGIGLAKRMMLSPTRSSGEIEAMRAIKQALDPREILGRGRVLPPVRPASSRDTEWAPAPFEIRA